MELNNNFTLSEQAVIGLMLKLNEYKYKTIDNTLSNVVLINKKLRKKLILQPEIDKVLLSVYEKENKKSDYELSFTNEYKCFKDGSMRIFNYSCYESNEKTLNLQYFYPENEDCPNKIVLNFSDEDEIFKGEFEYDGYFPKVKETLAFSKNQLLSLIEELEDEERKEIAYKKVAESTLNSFFLENNIYYDDDKFGIVFERKISELNFIIEDAVLNRNIFDYITKQAEFDVIARHYEKEIELFMHLYMPVFLIIANYILETNNTLEQSLIKKKIYPVDAVNKVAFICDFFNFSSPDFHKILEMVADELGL
jgi:hypothetical protein